MSYKGPFSINKNICATSWQRLAHYIIDMIVIYAIALFFIIVVSHLTVAFDFYGFGEWIENMSDLEAQLVFFIFLLTYFIVIETLTSRSLAKYITGTIVVLEDGSKPDFGTITKRTLCRVIPFDALSFFSTNARGWHDSISDTFVVNKNRLETMKRVHNELDEIGTNHEI
jgi:uncharacterized RDD family membrane protein YckC